MEKGNELRREHDLSEKIVQCSLLLLDIEKSERASAAGTGKRIGMESELASKAPARASTTDRTVRGRNKREKLCFRNRIGIETIIANHFEMFVRDMNNETLNEFKSRDFLNNEAIITMSVVVKSNGRTIVRVDTRGGNNRTTEIS